MKNKYLETSEENNWKPCMMCGGEITQLREAKFKCSNCNQEYISCEEDMKP